MAGDFWIRLADASGIGLAELLDANDSTVDTPLYPGSTICLPDGATVPAPPVTTSPTTIPATSQAPAPVTTAKPVATTPATTVKPVVSYPTPSAAAVQQIIRDVWPDELEDRAIEIAGRESNFVATARNSCCYGLFQMQLDSPQGLARRTRHHQPGATVRRDEQRVRGLRPLPALRRMGPVDVNLARIAVDLP